MEGKFLVLEKSTMPCPVTLSQHPSIGMQSMEVSNFSISNSKLTSHSRSRSSCINIPHQFNLSSYLGWEIISCLNFHFVSVYHLFLYPHKLTCVPRCTECQLFASLLLFLCILLCVAGGWLSSRLSSHLASGYVLPWIGTGRRAGTRKWRSFWCTFYQQ